MKAVYKAAIGIGVVGTLAYLWKRDFEKPSNASYGFMPGNEECSNPQEQCKAVIASGDSLLACRYKSGHTGNHKTCYINGREWL